MTSTAPHLEFPPTLMTRELAAYYLSASLREVDYLRANGQLVAVGTGKRVKFRKEDLDRYVNRLGKRDTRRSGSGPSNAQTRTEGQ